MQAAHPAARKPDPEATRKIIGGVLYALGMLAGALLLLFVFVIPAFASKNSGDEVSAMLIGALFAMPMLVIYLWVPWIIDRYDPEPWWCLLIALSWGGIAACGFSALINTMVHLTGNAVGGATFGDVLGACVSAPIVEEFTKGMAVFGIFFFLRRQFDGVVDGVIYATFAALGFAAVENVIYYGNAAKTEMLGGQEGVLAGTFVVRGILAPWGHPLYTSMTGLGFGIARETNKTWLKWLAPLGGYMFAAFLHSVWNTAATLSNALVLLMLPLWFLFVLAFFILVVWMVKRKGKIIHDHLRDEVLMGNLTPWELALVTSPIGRIKATFSYGGSAGRKFIDAAARLALSKWHTGRATQGRKLTVSADMIFPLRQDLHRLRGEVSKAMGRPVQQPQPWSPGAPNPLQPQGAPQPQPYGAPQHPGPQQWRG
ncbi:MAG: PrsW family intramembrane metalloprotease [Deltaproteobacteria bacterium]|nr:PrsW family intramembrane metalloprotease [Deltaproteobacteria bacterium]